ncbi:MAG: maleylpyruvate isomerase N-terminal domain-containing protein [Microthrixaceae bacterium]
MGTRPLRQYLSDYPQIDVADDLQALVVPWRRHRRRFAERLGALTEAQWAMASRCDAWSVRDVVCHLVTTDAFWLASLAAAASGTPSTYLVDFDPSTSPESFVAPMRALADDEVLARFRDGTDAFVDAVEGLDADVWAQRGESPMGHVPVRLVVGHAFWDSWLHERDVFVELGRALPVEPDELAAVTWYALVAGSLQGGLIDDPAPVGPGLTEPLDVTLGFDDLPDDPLRLRTDQGVRLERGGGDATSVGAALDMVESLTGRRQGWSADRLPPALADHLRRAFQIL